MARPRQMKVNRDGVGFVIGEDGNFSWAEIDALQLQIARWNMHRPKNHPVKKLSAEMLKAVLGVKRVFPGAVVEDWR